MVDYREDMRFSDEMIKRVAEAYRKVRNTCRYLLSNLNDFDPARDAVPEEELDEIDRYALNRHRQVAARVLEAYETYEFHVVYHQLVQYAAADLSSVYFDVLKDRLYCDPAAGTRRRSAQTVLHRIAGDLCRLLAPVLPFTTDEAWAGDPRGSAEASVHLALFPERRDRRTRRCSSAGPGCSTSAPWPPRPSRRPADAKQLAASLEAVADRDRARPRPWRRCASTRRRAPCSRATSPTCSS